MEKSFKHAASWRHASDRRANAQLVICFELFENLGHVLLHGDMLDMLQSYSCSALRRCRNYLEQRSTYQQQDRRFGRMKNDIPYQHEETSRTKKTHNSRGTSSPGAAEGREPEVSLISQNSNCHSENWNDKTEMRILSKHEDVEDVFAYTHVPYCKDGWQADKQAFPRLRDSADPKLAKHQEPLREGALTCLCPFSAPWKKNLEGHNNKSTTRRDRAEGAESKSFAT